MTANRPTDIELPSGWTWERVEAERAKWGTADNMVPVCTIPGACTAWCTINSVRMDKAQAAYEADCKARPTYHTGEPRKRWHQLSEIVRDSWLRNPTPRWTT